MAKRFNYDKEEYRGAIKQIMKVRGLRTISLANYDKWIGRAVDYKTEPHSLKLNLQDGYVNIYAYKRMESNRLICGDIIDNGSAELYKNAYEKVKEIIANEGKIPSKVKKNILVSLCR